jgi:hypothetical protein
MTIKVNTLQLDVQISNIVGHCFFGISDVLAGNPPILLQSEAYEGTLRDLIQHVLTRVTQFESNLKIAILRGFTSDPNSDVDHFLTSYENID